MQFEVNGQMYFLDFVPGEGRWYMSAPKPDGLERLPVMNDARHYGVPKLVMPPEVEEQGTIN